MKTRWLLVALLSVVWCVLGGDDTVIIRIELANGIELSFQTGEDQRVYSQNFTIQYASKITRARIRFGRSYDFVNVTSKTKFVIQNKTSA